MAPESPQPLKFWGFSQLLARDCRRGWCLPPRLRGHLLEVGCSAKCPEMGTRQETAEPKIRKQVSEEGRGISTIPQHRHKELSIGVFRHNDSLTHNHTTSTELWTHQTHYKKKKPEELNLEVLINGGHFRCTSFKSQKEDTWRDLTLTCTSHSTNILLNLNKSIIIWYKKYFSWILSSYRFEGERFSFIFRRFSIKKLIETRPGVQQCQA